MKAKLTLTTLTTVLAGLSLAVRAAPVVYEPFDYTAGALAGNGTGTTGLDGNWTSGGTNEYQVEGTGLSFTNLSTTGGAADRSSANNGAYSQVGITNAAQTSLLADDSTIYFSFLVGYGNNSEVNDNSTFYLGTSDAPSATAAPVTTTSGSGFGFALDGPGAADNSRPLRGFTMDGGTTTLSASDIGVIANGTSGTLMIAGQIDWAANGSNDTLTLWNVADPAAGLGGTSISMTADFDQSTFDTLTIASRQNNTPLDEIRFGTSLADVAVVPEPSSLALIGLAGLATLLYRRQNG